MMMVQLELGSSSLDQENKIGIMGYEDHDEDDSFSSDASSLVSSDDESDDTFEVNDILSGSSPSSDDDRPITGEHALADMSALLQQLPSKRGLSKHFQGKSQSFTSLSKVTCLQDLAKPENPYNNKLKSCKSYMGLSRVLPPPTRSASSSKLFTKKPPSGASCSSLSIGRNGSYLGLSNNSRPPTHSSLNNGATTTSPLIV